MHQSHHIFIHPWLNRETQWGGLILSGSGGGRECCAGVAQLCRDADTASLGHQLNWYVPVDPESCFAEFSAWPKGRTIFLVEEPENAETDENWLQLAETLRTLGHKVGVIAFPHHPIPPAGGPWDCVVMETCHARTAPPVKLILLASQSTIIMSGVKARLDFDWGVANQASLMGAEFLLSRSAEPSQRDVMRAHLLRLLSLVTQDADTREIEEVFRQEPKLSYSLLRLVNSAALSLRMPVTSFSQAITLLGRRQLQRWLQLLVYADPGGDHRANPLLLWAAMRGRLMELAFQHFNPAPQLAIESDSAFMAGIFSLLDVLLNLPMEEILSQLPVASTVKLALTERAGPLGELLRAVEAAERRKFKAASETLTGLGISCSDYAQAQLAAIDWANNVSRQAD
ncbi:MAG: EAL and HDOD domain-containing protein [Betaproteobacteria bacterium]